ncbi:hypothetical protein ACH0R4_RS14415 [Bacillus cytotoxicus]|nr:hypothetical protein [Bacillus cereus group sp. BfR-BA-01492]EMA6344511.1 hypothetical protein [Bacillus cytotoxicus]
MKKFFSNLSIIFLLIILGGCNMDEKKEEQIVEKATKTTIKYFKEKENLDVVITEHQFAPEDFQTVFITGHVKNDESKSFTVDVEYSDDEYRVTSKSYSKNLELKN